MKIPTECIRLFSVATIFTVLAAAVGDASHGEDWPRKEATAPAASLDDWGTLLPDVAEVMREVPPFVHDDFATAGTRWQWQMNGRGEVRYVYIGKANIKLTFVDANGSQQEIRPEPEPGKTHISDLPAPGTEAAAKFPLPKKPAKAGGWQAAEKSDTPAAPVMRYYAVINYPGQSNPYWYGPFFRYSTAANVVAAHEKKGRTGKVVEKRAERK